MYLKIYNSRKSATNFDSENITKIINDDLAIKNNKSIPELIMEVGKCSYSYASYICDEYYKTDRMLVYITKTNRIKCIFWTGGGDFLSSNYRNN
jgi:hypothetical protein